MMFSEPYGNYNAQITITVVLKLSDINMKGFCRPSLYMLHTVYCNCGYYFPFVFSRSVVCVKHRNLVHYINAQHTVGFGVF